MERDFDIVVIGGGHAGVEAAWVAARLGTRTALVMLSAGTIAAMSCNPAIGGIGKGQIVREIDALGGLMGLAADATGIQFRMLNRSKGPAVWGPRCQSDRHAYAAWMQAALSREGNLTILAGQATDILTENGCVVGVRVALTGDGDTPAGAPGRDQTVLSCRAAVVTAGTFLNGLMHLGERTWPGGRYDEPAATELSESLVRSGLQRGRLKTGTCPRIASETIDYGQCTRQDGDSRPSPFSFLNDTLQVEQLPCWITSTNEQVHQVIRANLHRAPMYTGQIRSTGPRYCPSLETKIVRFPDRPGHQVFLEPEGRDTNWVYCKGVSTSMPAEVQEQIVRLIPGLRKASIVRFGYAIEYDYFPPTQLRASLETKGVTRLFLAGQVNGTTGYEEAAGQGLVAGINAALKVRGRPGLVLRRDQAYIGVMIDDLVTKGVTEPYRMFTSRSEHRLSLRADNADRRLTEIGRQIGLVDDWRWQRYQAKRQAIDQAGRLFDTTRIDGVPLRELLKRPDLTLEAILIRAGGEPAELAGRNPSAVESAVTDARYAGYLAKEQAALRQMQELDARLIPESVDYASVSHLRQEAREKLSAIRPRSLGQALRISGITPADVTVLAIHLAARQGRKVQ